MTKRRRKFLKGCGFAAAAVVLLAAAAMAHPRGRFYAALGARAAQAKVGALKVDLAPARARLEAELPGGTALPLSDARIVILKSQRLLELRSGDRLMKRYSIGLGQSPEDTKLRQGDSRTPEGEYHICRRRLGTRDWIFLGLNYPTARDARVAVESGLIGEAVAREIETTERKKATPPWDTAMGGAIGIHGGGAKDWTAGCIAVEDRNIEELYVATSHWTPVEILP